MRHRRHEDVAATYHLGDLVGYAPWPDETVALIQSRGISGVAGNYDSTVGTDYKHCGCRYEDPRQEELSHISYNWTRQHVSTDTKGFLAGLPFRIDLLPNGGHMAGPRVILVHGTPTLNTLYWTEDRSDDFCLKMASHAGAKAGDVIAFGHTHIPWHRRCGGIHFVNTGSVGRPKDGDWRAGYVVLEIGSRDRQGRESSGSSTTSSGRYSPSRTASCLTSLPSTCGPAVGPPCRDDLG